MVLQTEAAECGIACLAMFANYFGFAVDLADIRRRAGVSLRGATLKDLMRIADQLGLSSRPVRLELEEIHMLKTPCILHWDLNHFVVLKDISKTAFVIHDPAVGIRRMGSAEVSKHFTGVALELTPTHAFQPAQSPPRVKFRSLIGRVVGLKRSLINVLLLALAIEVLAMISPLFIQWVVDHALVTANADLLLTLVLGFGLVLLLKTSLLAMRGWTVMVLGAALKVQSRANLFTHLVSLPTAYFEARHLGDVLSRFGSQETILQAITTDLVEAVLDGVMAMFTLVIMFIFAPVLTVVVLIGTVLYALLRWVSYTPLRQAGMEAIVWGARRDSHFLETLRGIKTIKLRNGQGARRTRWLNLLVETVNRQLETQKLQLLFRTARGFLIGALQLIVVWMGANLILSEQNFSVGMLFAFVSYKDQFLNHVTELINKGVDLYMLRLHAERLADIVMTEGEPRPTEPLPMPHEQLPVTIEIRDLHFRYSDNDPWILNGLNLTIPAGQSIAVVGASGCGKTTLLKILASLLKPTHGDILVNGRPLNLATLEHYRALIGVVLQDDHLFAGSIADNISFFADRPDMALIEECAKKAAVHEDIVAMPMSYSTLIGDMGTVLSGGQKQRGLVARALYHQPQVLLFDEATSHLDIGKEKAVNEAIQAMQPTRIVVAHRPETICSAQRVIVIKEGRIIRDEMMPATSTELPLRLHQILQSN